MMKRTTGTTLSEENQYVRGQPEAWTDTAYSEGQDLRELGERLDTRRNISS